MSKKIKPGIKVKPKRGRKVKTAEELKADINSKKLSIRTLIKSASNFKLSELQPLVSKAMSDELGINHGRLLNKLRNPEKFSMQEIHKFCYYTLSDVERLTQIINTEILNNAVLASKLQKFRSVDKLKQYNKGAGKTNRQL